MNEILPLNGIKIIDFTRLLPGPLGTHLLSQLGADVLKVESPKRMDYTRYYQPFIKDVSSIFLSINHSKTQVIVDYESKDGFQQIINEIKTADVLIEQFRPGVMKRFNLSFEEVKKINSNIVYISVTGYGQSSQKKEKAGHDINYIAESGLLSLNRDESGKPVIPGFQIADIAGGAYMVVSACTTGLLAQKLQHKAQFIDVSIYDATLPLGAVGHGMLQGGMNYNEQPILSGSMVNYNVYKCKDGKWVALGALELKFWNLFCEMVGKPMWKTDKSEDLISGVFGKKKLEQLFKTKMQKEWIDLSNDYDVCLSAVVELEELNVQNTTDENILFNKTTINNQTINTYQKPFKTYLG